jgi:hypothetical protein
MRLPLSLNLANKQHHVSSADEVIHAFQKARKEQVSEWENEAFSFARTESSSRRVLPLVITLTITNQALCQSLPTIRTFRILVNGGWNSVYVHPWRNGLTVNTYDLNFLMSAGSQWYYNLSCVEEGPTDHLVQDGMGRRTWKRLGRDSLSSEQPFQNFTPSYRELYPHNSKIPTSPGDNQNGEARPRSSAFLGWSSSSVRNDNGEQKVTEFSRAYPYFDETNCAGRSALDEGLGGRGGVTIEAIEPIPTTLSLRA